jgi:hypothetical protein
MDLRTSLAGLELTLDTLSEISLLLKRLDEQLKELSPDFPQVANGNVKGLTTDLASTLASFEEALSMMASRSASLLGHAVETSHAPAAAAPAPKPAEPKPAAPTVEPAAAEEVSVPAPVQASEEPEEEAEEEKPAQAPAPAPAGKVQARVTVPAEGLLEGEPIWDSVPAAGGQNWAYALADGLDLRDEAELSQPLKPVETPSAENPLGAIGAVGRGVIYSQGKDLKKFWPGSGENKVSVESPIPAEAWRVMNFKENVYCVGPNRVEVINAANWAQQKPFAGTYVNQAHTDEHWAGLLNKDGELFLELRDASSALVGEAVSLGAAGDGAVYLAAAGDTVFVGKEAGEIYRVQGGAAEQIWEGEGLLSLALHTHGIFIAHTSSEGVVASMLDRDGNILAECMTGIQSLGYQPVLLGEYYYMFDNAASELLVGSLETFEVLQQKAVQGVAGVKRMVGLSHGDTEMLAILACDAQGKPTETLLHSPMSGSVHKLCRVNVPNAQIAYVDGHIAVATASSYQNMIQVFSLLKQHAAAEAA